MLLKGSFSILIAVLAASSNYFVRANPIQDSVARSVDSPSLDSPLHAEYPRADTHKIHASSPAPTSSSNGPLIDTHIQVINERDLTAVSGELTSELITRNIVSSPYARRTIQLTLKRALHGIAAGTSFVWQISYRYIAEPARKTVTGNLVFSDHSGTFNWDNFHIDEEFVNAVDGILTATFNAFIRETGQKLSFTVQWSEEFRTNSATIENHGLKSAASYFSPSGHQEVLNQDWFSYLLKQS